MILSIKMVTRLPKLFVRQCVEHVEFHEREREKKTFDAQESLNVIGDGSER